MIRRQKTTKRGTSTVLTFKTYADYLKWLNANEKQLKVFDVREGKHEKQE